MLAKRKAEPARQPNAPEAKSFDVLHRAYKKAQTILGRAELDQIKINASMTLKAEKKIEEYMETLTKEGKEHVKKFLTEAENAAMEATKKSLEDYKATQMKALDDNIAEVTKRTAELVLTKRIDMNTHVELIYEALQQAKKEKLIT